MKETVYAQDNGHIVTVSDENGYAVDEDTRNVLVLLDDGIVRGIIFRKGLNDYGLVGKDTEGITRVCLLVLR